MTKPFNPLAMENLAESIVHALHLQEPVPLALVSEFDGAGVYALYYHGKLLLLTQRSSSSRSTSERRHRAVLEKELSLQHREQR